MGFIVPKTRHHLLGAGALNIIGCRPQFCRLRSVLRFVGLRSVHPPGHQPTGRPSREISD
eukprot:2481011-Prymnesium_polylepis.1